MAVQSLCGRHRASVQRLGHDESRPRKPSRSLAYPTRCESSLRIGRRINFSNMLSHRRIAGWKC